VQKVGESVQIVGLLLSTEHVFDGTVVARPADPILRGSPREAIYVPTTQNPPVESYLVFVVTSAPGRVRAQKQAEAELLRLRGDTPAGYTVGLVYGVVNVLVIAQIDSALSVFQSSSRLRSRRQSRALPSSSCQMCWRKLDSSFITAARATRRAPSAHLTTSCVSDFDVP
jgi:hypothetical protein